MSTADDLGKITITAHIHDRVKTIVLHFVTLHVGLININTFSSKNGSGSLSGAGGACETFGGGNCVILTPLGGAEKINIFLNY